MAIGTAPWAGAERILGAGRGEMGSSLVFNNFLDTVIIVIHVHCRDLENSEKHK